MQFRCILRSMIAIGLAHLLARTSNADQFEALDGKLLSRTVAEHPSEARKRLTTNEISALPALLTETRSPLLVVKTSLGNYARVLVVPELRKPTAGKGDPFPVLLLERFETFDAANKVSRIAKGRDMVLFNGFQADLDTGQIVPDGEGGDLRFVASMGESPRLESVGTAELYVLKSLPLAGSGKIPQPTPGRRVVASDFAGRYQLYSNGQMSGRLDLLIDSKGVVTGQFRSDAQGSSFEVTGQVSKETPQRVLFTIKFPRSTQEFDGYLWADGKGALAGTTTVLEKTHGFFAVREGGRIAPIGVEITEAAQSKEEGLARITVSGTGLTLGSKSVSIEELGRTLQETRPSSITIEVEPDTPYRVLDAVLKQSNAAEIERIRVGVIPPPTQK